jgi:dTDP-4-amino-4,6-dideoxygalactose transaminase
VGGNYKLSAISAALGISSLARLQTRIETHRKNARRLLSKIQSGIVHELRSAALGDPNYYSLVVEVDLPPTSTKNIVDECCANGLHTDRTAFGYDLLYRRPLLAEHKERWPRAESFIDSCVQLPCHPGLSDEHSERIAAIFNHAVGGNSC